MSKKESSIVTLPNVITCVRIVFSVSLIFCETFSCLFYVFYVISGLSDFFDGIVARRFNQTTSLGAKLDTAADVLFTGVTLIKVIRAFEFPKYVIIVVICVAVMKCFNALLGLIKHKHFMAEHIFLNKLCGVIIFVIPFCIGLFPRNITLIILAVECVLTIVAAIVEGYYIYIGKEVN